MKWEIYAVTKWRKYRTVTNEELWKPASNQDIEAPSGNLEWDFRREQMDISHEKKQNSKTTCIPVENKAKHFHRSIIKKFYFSETAKQLFLGWCLRFKNQVYLGKYLTHKFRLPYHTSMKTVDLMLFMTFFISYVAASIIIFFILQKNFLVNS